MSAPATSPPGVTGYRPGPITRATAILHRAGPWLLRGSLALVLIWFGALKVAGLPTMPAALIAAITPPFVDPGLLARLTGVLEVALGAGLLIGRWKPVVLAGVTAQLAGTFLVLLLRPDVAFLNGNPFALSVEGEYVVKNLVLLAAALTLAGMLPSRTAPGRRNAT